MQASEILRESLKKVSSLISELEEDILEHLDKELPC
jgi:hypothetical protein